MSLLFDNVIVDETTSGVGLSTRASVKAGSTTVVDFLQGLENGDTLDGITLATDDRILIKDQVDQAEITDVTVPAGSSFNSTNPANYLLLYSANNSTTYAFWFNRTDGSTTSPAVGGATNVQVDITGADADAVVATALKTAVDLYPADFSTGIATATVTVTNASNGPANDVDITNMPGSTTAPITQHGAAASENGIYIIQASEQPERSSDFDTGSQAGAAFIIVQQGTVNGDTGWLCTNDLGTDVVDTDPLTFKKTTGDIDGPGAGSSTDNAIIRWDGSSGTIIQNSVAILEDTGDLTTPGYVDADELFSTKGLNVTEATTLPITTGAGTGTLWVKDNSPNSLYFTDGGGTDHDVTPLSTKGDLMTHNGTIEIRVPVGADGNVLTAASGQPGGFTWSAVGGSDNIYNTDDSLTGNRTANMSGNSLAWTGNTGGGFGIGVTPTNFFEVRNKAIGASDHIQFIVSDQTKPDTYNLGVDTGDPGVVFATCEDGPNRQACVFASDSGGTSTIFGMSSSSDSGVTWDPRFVICHNGLVGINKNDPGQALDVDGDFHGSGAINLDESATAGITATAGNGTLWVKNDTPNTLRFTDDAGTSHDVTPLSAKGDIVVHNGTIEVRLPVGSNNQFLVADSAQSEGVDWKDLSDFAQPTYTVTFVNNDSRGYIRGSFTTLRLHGDFVFRGTSDTPVTVCKAIVYMEGAATGTIEVFDATNINTICSTTFTNTTKAIVDLGTLSNLPAGVSDFEIQLKSSSGFIRYRAYSLIMH